MAGARCFGVSYVFLYQIYRVIGDFRLAKKSRTGWVMMHEYLKRVHTNKRTSFHTNFTTSF